MATHSSVLAWRIPGMGEPSRHTCPTLCNPRYGSPPGSPVPGILLARTLERGQGCVYKCVYVFHVNPLPKSQFVDFG